MGYCAPFQLPLTPPEHHEHAVRCSQYVVNIPCVTWRVHQMSVDSEGTAKGDMVWQSIDTYEEWAPETKSDQSTVDLATLLTVLVVMLKSVGQCSIHACKDCLQAQRSRQDSTLEMVWLYKYCFPV